MRAKEHGSPDGVNARDGRANILGWPTNVRFWWATWRRRNSFAPAEAGDGVRHSGVLWKVDKRDGCADADRTVLHDCGVSRSRTNSCLGGHSDTSFGASVRGTTARQPGAQESLGAGSLDRE